MDEELNSSDLGSHEYWDKVYKDEIDNFNDYGDVGEIWFGKEASKRVINWINENPSIKRDDAILDLGCGNGMLLIDLYEKGFTNLHGVDYSQYAINLAKAIAEKRQYSINFFVGNILDHSFSLIFNIILDKGTYDAISLHPEDSKSKRQTYIKNINTILKEKGYFVITSCNWTENELLKHFNDLSHVKTLPAPTFQFGGKIGKTITSVIFEKR